MKSKADVIKKELSGLRVLDLGGSGFGADNAYERQLKDAWSLTASRTTVDYSTAADIRADLNDGLPDLSGKNWDITTAFDVLEHLENPVKLLREIPTERLIVSLPNVLSPFCRHWEKTDRLHLYTFTDYTAEKLIATGGWKVDRLYYTFGKWSFFTQCINIIGSVFPPYVGSGLMIHCSR
ncbi:MAG: hypothetical protein WC959_00860 [Kiritimatiellales bacterium]